MPCRFQIWHHISPGLSESRFTVRNPKYCECLVAYYYPDSNQLDRNHIQTFHWIWSPGNQTWTLNTRLHRKEDKTSEIIFGRHKSTFWAYQSLLLYKINCSGPCTGKQWNDAFADKARDLLISGIHIPSTRYRIPASQRETDFTTLLTVYPACLYCTFEHSVHLLAFIWDALVPLHSDTFNLGQHYDLVTHEYYYRNRKWADPVNNADARRLFAKCECVVCLWNFSDVVIDHVPIVFVCFSSNPL